ncbi:MAG: inorganic diphosphatase [Methylacidiphilales bacterium]|nr:inorganic diphosphatase [Candidatus Methylacidiphilales bacterium]
MNINEISPGSNPPQDINTIIEIPALSNIKYELCKKSNAILVDRFVATPMHYPLNYGFIPHTLAGDGDPLDVLVVTPNSAALLPGSVIRVRPIGALFMDDEAGGDEKIIAVPHSKISTMYDSIKETDHLPELLKKQIEHFFLHYKDLEPGKWVKLKGWLSLSQSHDVITKAIANYTN